MLGFHFEAVPSTKKAARLLLLKKTTITCQWPRSILSLELLNTISRQLFRSTALVCMMQFVKIDEIGVAVGPAMRWLGVQTPPTASIIGRRRDVHFIQITSST